MLLNLSPRLGSRTGHFDSRCHWNAHWPAGLGIRARPARYDEALPVHFGWNSDRRHP